MKLLYHLLFCLSGISTYAVEYLYPVGTGTTSEGEQVMYLIYQHSLDYIELFAWNPIEGVAHKTLLPVHLPAFFNLLPDNSGFSFIDQGRIRIKQFEKRSPFTIPLYAPIDTIASVEWIDSSSCYFTARLGQQFGIFSTDFEGNMQTLLYDEAHDFLYPQQRNDKLFFIRRSQPGIYAIGLKTKQMESYEVILDFEDMPIAFLHMIDETQGLVIQHQAYLDQHDTFTLFHCWYLYHDETGWHKKHLFEFNIPLDLFFGNMPERLYESIIPLLPTYIEGTIFFIHYNTSTERLGMYRYDIANEKYTLAFAPKAPTICCAPCSLFGLIFYGGTVVDYNVHIDAPTYLPSMWLDEEHMLHINVPFMMPTQQG